MTSKEISFWESISFNAWPSFETIIYDGWILRFANGYTKRSNSINPIFKSTLNLRRKMDYCHNLFQNRNLPIVYKITDEVHPINLDAILEKEGFQIVDPTLVLMKTFNSLNAINPSQVYISSKNVSISDELTSTWLNACVELNNVSVLEINNLKRILKQISCEKWFYLLYKGDSVIGCGLGVQQDTYYGIFDFTISEPHRNQGNGHFLLQEMLKHAESKGNTNVYLQVVKANTPARNLYKKCGFTTLYEYWYRKK